MKRDDGAPPLQSAAPLHVDSPGVVPWVTRSPLVYAWTFFLLRSSPLACRLRILVALAPAALYLGGYWELHAGVGALLVLMAAVFLWVERRSLVTRPAWMDPQTTGSNRLEPHTPLVAYETFDDAVARRRRTCNSISSLNGTWKFSLVPSPARAPRDFKDPSFDDASWPDIAVPGHWQLQDAGRADIPIYTNTNYPFPNTPPFVPNDDNPTGLYRRRFDLPAGWDLQHCRVVLILRGVDSACQIWVDGTLVGSAKDSRTPAEFDITAALRASATAAAAGGSKTGKGEKNPGGRHVVAVQVPRWSDGSFLEDQDHWLLSGLYRDVELLRLPAAVRIADYTVRATLLPPPWAGMGSKAAEGALAVAAGGRLEVEVELEGEGVMPTAGGHLECTLIDTALSKASAGSAGKGPGITNVPTSGKPWRHTWGDINSKFRSSAKKRGQPAGRQTFLFALDVPALRPWSAEDPQLYTLVVALKMPSSGDKKGGGGVATQFESARVGFRSVKVEGGQLLVNGAAIVVAGVNRHEHEPATGKTVDEASMKRDILLLKRNNFNAVRNSHYPNHWRWYELCDELGMYVCDEANIETHGQMPMGRLSDDPYWRRAYLDRCQRMVRASKNHASVIIWSLGNESGDGSNLAACRAWIKRWEPSRPVHYESGGKLVEGTGRTNLTDLVCPMYPTPALVKMLGGPKLGETRPVVLCEYSHSMGNSCGNLHEYWDLFWDKEHPRLQGGFIWDFVDQGLNRVDPVSGRTYWAYGGEFGDMYCDGYQRFCNNGICFPDRSPHPALLEAKSLQQPVLVSLLDASTNNADGLSLPSSGSGSPGALPNGAAAGGSGGPAAAVRLRVRSRYSFLDLSHLTLRWEAVTDGGGIGGDGVVAAGELPLPKGGLPGPGESVVVEIPPERLDLRALTAAAGAAELFLRVTARQARQTVWADAGHEVAVDQFLVEAVAPQGGERDKGAAPSPMGSPAASVSSVSSAALSAAASMRGGGSISGLKKGLAEVSEGLEEEPIAVEEEDEDGEPVPAPPTSERDLVVIRPRSRRWELALSRRTGLLTRLRSAGKDLLADGGGPEFCFVRAATDNDGAGYDTLVRFVGPPGSTAVATKLMPLSLLSHHERWRSVGLTAAAPPTQRLTSFEVDERPPESPRSFAATATWVVESAAGAATPSKPLFEVSICYGVGGSGAVKMDCGVKPLFAVPPSLSLARVGLHLQAAPGLSNATWFGRGPHESYWDRKRGAPIGRYAAKVADLPVPYIHPTESGGRSDVRWAALLPEDDVSGSSGAGGLLFRGGEPMQLNAGYHTPAEVEAAARYIDLPQRDPAACGAHVHLDHKHMGIGGDNTWLPDTVHDEFLVKVPQKTAAAVAAFSFTVWMAPLAPGERPEAKAASLAALASGE